MIEISKIKEDLALKEAFERQEILEESGQGGLPQDCRHALRPRLVAL